MANAEISIDKKEVLRYLGYRGTYIPEKLDVLIDECMKKTLAIISPKYLTKRFNLMKTEGGIHLNNTDILLTGNDIKNHLAHCDEAFLLCATIGLEIEKLIRQKMIISPDEGVIYDSCATAAIENTADMAERFIVETAHKEKLKTTWRFSAGYGDLPLETQKSLVVELDTMRKIGVTVNPAMLLTPGKSVTAIIGLGQVAGGENSTQCRGCKTCKNRKTCEFSRMNLNDDGE